MPLYWIYEEEQEAFVPGMSSSLRSRLVVLVLVATLPLLAITVYVAHQLRQAELRNARERLATLAALADGQLRAAAESAEQLLGSLAKIPGVAEGEDRACAGAFRSMAGEDRRYASFVVADEHGNVRCHSAGKFAAVNVSDRLYFRRARDTGRFFAGEPVIGRMVGKPLFVMSLPLHDADGRFRGVLFGGLDLQWFGDRFVQDEALGGIALAVWSEDGTILYRNSDTQGRAAKATPERAVARAVVARTSERALGEDDGSSGQHLLYAIQGTEKWSGTRMSVAVGLPREGLLREANDLFARSLAAFGIVFAMALTAALFLAEFGVRRRAVAVASAARRIAAGDLGARTGLTTSPDELGQLAAAFDRMAATLEKANRILKVLSESNQALVRAREESGLLADVCRIVVEHGGYRDCASRVADGSEDERDPGGAAILRRASVVVARIDDWPDDEWRRSARERGFAAFAALPIEAEGEVFGAIAIAAAEFGRFDRGELDLLEELAADLGYGIQALRTRRELDRHAGKLEGLVAQRTAALEAANRFLDSLIENIPDMIFVKEAGELRFVRFNRAGEDLLGYSREELVGRNDHDFFPKDEADFFTRRDREVLAGGAMVEIEEEPIHTRHRGVRYLHTKKIPVPEPSGGAGYLLGISQDITDRKEREREILALNARLSERAAELESVNRELEAFSYSVSHDLRAPLRHVQGYVEMLSAATQGQLPDKAERYLRIISEAAVEMGELIDDLLQFSRTSRVEMRRASVDMRSLVRECLTDLEVQIRDRHVDWRIGDLPEVPGDPGLLKQVWANLLGNAAKYTRPRDPAVIEVGVRRADHGPDVFFVRDNGVGFDMRHAKNLFGVFHRLHRADEFEGTGIGLATVQRIVARHGGRIWAEAAPGRGAAFFFTLAGTAIEARAEALA